MFRLLKPPTKLLRFPFSSYQLNPNESDSHTLELYDEHYLSYRKEEFKKAYRFEYSDRIPGFATTEATCKYSQRRKDYINEKHFRKPYHDNLYLTSLGIGTYVGAPDESDDLKVIKYHTLNKLPYLNHRCLILL